MLMATTLGSKGTVLAPAVEDITTWANETLSTVERQISDGRR